ncbi:hypothetical protein [Ferrimonas lipolytica]|uniref:Uncharacterized protein n=1 Tax=Ferrimonas lipolytica TaxID=2724191 RepID=A0A6H1UH83_9GAMM|nr:hypothetical protein [Ferrimonas lipolytica]QIZ77989.1 hypothetical protein HER31_14445 [Ferrimonas lipolytica]
MRFITADGPALTAVMPSRLISCNISNPCIYRKQKAVYQLSVVLSNTDKAPTWRVLIQGQSTTAVDLLPHWSSSAKRFELRPKARGIPKGAELLFGFCRHRDILPLSTEIGEAEGLI